MRACGNWRRNRGDGGDRASTPKVKKEKGKKLERELESDLGRDTL